MSLGTSGTIYTIMNNEPFVDLDGEVASFCDATGKYMPLICISNMANGFEDALKHFKLSYDDFEYLVSETGVGNFGKIICILIILF